MTPEEQKKKEKQQEAAERSRATHEQMFDKLNAGVPAIEPISKPENPPQVQQDAPLIAASFVEGNGVAEQSADSPSTKELQQPEREALLAEMFGTPDGDTTQASNPVEGPNYWTLSIEKNADGGFEVDTTSSNATTRQRDESGTTLSADELKKIYPDVDASALNTGERLHLEYETDKYRVEALSRPKDDGSREWVKDEVISNPEKPEWASSVSEVQAKGADKVLKERSQPASNPQPAPKKDTLSGIKVDGKTPERTPQLQAKIDARKQREGEKRVLGDNAKPEGQFGGMQQEVLGRYGAGKDMQQNVLDSYKPGGSRSPTPWIKQPQFFGSKAAEVANDLNSPMPTPQRDTQSGAIDANASAHTQVLQASVQLMADMTQELNRMRIEIAQISATLNRGM